MVLQLYAGLGVVLGHNFPFYMGFRGGKGIAATSGVILGLFDYRLLLLAFFTFFIVLLISKYVSLASLCLMAGFFIEFVVFVMTGLIDLKGTDRIEGIVLVFIITALAFVKHRSNIQRIIAGNERKIGQPKDV